MTAPDGIDTAIQRKMLRLAVRNSARSVPLLTVAVLFLAYLGWQAHDPIAATLMLVVGLPVSAWRWWLDHVYGPQESIDPARILGVVWQLESNTALVGAMWAVATIFIYPTLTGTTATVYVVIICGSISTAAFFLSMAGRSFVLLSALQLGALAVVSVLPGPAHSLPLAVLAVLFGVTMLRATREFGNTALRSMRHSLEADEANASDRKSVV